MRTIMSLIDKRRSDIALALSDLGAVLSIKDGLARLVHLNLCDLDVRGVNAHVDGLTVSLIPGAALDVHDVLLAVALHDLALLALEPTAQHAHLVVLPQRQRANLWSESYKTLNHVN